jgi:membrane protease YdiL (CAAX protease family)
VSVSLLAGLPASALVAYLAVVLPVSGRARYRQLRARGTIAPGLRSLAYRSSIRRQWLLTGVALVVLVAAGAPLSELGLAPRIRHLHELVPGLLLLLALGAGLALLLRAWPRARQRALRPIAALLPVSAEERRLFIAVAVTAGVAEEILFRGFLLVYLTEVLPVSLGAAMIVSSALFGLAHAYQGPLGVALTAVAGYWLAGLYVLTGSLLLPAVVHALVDLRLLLVLPPESAKKAGSAEQSD